MPPHFEIRCSATAYHFIIVSIRDDADLEVEWERLCAEAEDEQLEDAEGDFPAKMAPPSRPHREDVDDEVTIIGLPNAHHCIFGFFELTPFNSSPSAPIQTQLMACTLVLTLPIKS